MKIVHTVIPAAGLGTRFLPFTKAIPKELLPIGAQPALQLVIEEAITSGITNVGIIANSDKPAIKHYFSPDHALDEHLRRTGKKHLVDDINAIIQQTSFTYIPQEEPLGLGHAVLQAHQFVGDNYFGVMLPDELMYGTSPCLQQLVEKALEYNASIIAVQEVPKNMVSSYGIIKSKKMIDDTFFEIEDLIEKPTPENAPSNLAIIGRYILSPKIFNALKNTRPGCGNEIQLTDGIHTMMKQGEPVFAYKVNSIRHDIGNPAGWLEANIFYGLKNPLYKDSLKAHLTSLLQSEI